MISRVLFTAVITFLCAVSGLSSASAFTWQTEFMTDNAFIGCNKELEIDSAGGLHAVCNTRHEGGECVIYAYKATDEDDWVVDQIECVPVWFIGHYSDIALDSNQQPGFVYDQSNYETYIDYISYAYLDEGVWQIEQITEDDEDLRGSMSLVYDSTDIPHMFYGEGSYGGSLFHMWKPGDEWERELVDTNVGQGVHAIVDGNNTFHLAFYRDNCDDLYYGINDGSGWQFTAVETNLQTAGSADFDFTLDGNGLPHIVYRKTGWLLRHAWFDGENWELETISDNVLGNTSIAIDGAETVHVCYNIFDGPYDRPLTYSYNNGGGWVTEVVADVRDCDTTALKIDSSGRPHVIYRNLELEETCHAWPRDPAAVDNEGAWEPAASAFSLTPAYPNPTTGKVTIEFKLPGTSTISLSLLDVAGRKIDTRKVGTLAEGAHAIELNDLPRGVVFYRLETETQSVTRKLIIR